MKKLLLRVLLGFLILGVVVVGSTELCNWQFRRESRRNYNALALRAGMNVYDSYSLKPTNGGAWENGGVPISGEIPKRNLIGEESIV
jgi:hypothetical protein